MNRYQLELFTLAVEAKKISTAARLLHLTQPAVSNQIKHMERFYGVQLLSRARDGVKPTPAGAILYRYAKEILRQYDLLDREMDDLTGAEDQEVIIGTTYTVGNYTLPCQIWTFKDRFPRANLQVEIAPVPELVRRVLDRSTTLAVIEGPVPELEGHPGVRIRCLGTDAVLLVASPRSAWGGARLAPDAVPAVPLVLPSAGWGVREVFMARLAEQGLAEGQLTIKAQMGGMEAIKAAVDAGAGVGVITRAAVQKELRRGVFRDITPAAWKLPISFRVFYQDEFVPGVAKRFVRFITQPEEFGSC